MTIIGSYAGMPVTVSEHAIETVPRFPDKPNTKRRRRRVIGKFGSWVISRPCAIKIGGTLVMHPVIADRIRREHRHEAAL